METVVIGETGVRQPLGGFEPMGTEIKFVLGAATLFVFPAYIVLAGPIFGAAAAAARSFFV